MTNEWRFTLNGQPADSPVSAAQLKQLAVAGQLQPTDMVWQEGVTGWGPAASIKGLFPPSKLATPAPPSKKEKDGGKKTGEFSVIGGPAAKEPGGGLTDMHPLLVLLLTLLTVGIFGLFYAFRVSAVYTARAAMSKTDAAGRTLGPARHPVAVLLLSYLTFGFYSAYWTYRVMQECSVYSSGRDYASRSELTLMLLIPGYAIYAAVCSACRTSSGASAKRPAPRNSAPCPPPRCSSSPACGRGCRSWPCSTKTLSIRSGSRPHDSRCSPFGASPSRARPRKATFSRPDSGTDLRGLSCSAKNRSTSAASAPPRRVPHPEPRPQPRFQRLPGFQPDERRPVPRLHSRLRRRRQHLRMSRLPHQHARHLQAHRGRAGRAARRDAAATAPPQGRRHSPRNLSAIRGTAAGRPSPAAAPLRRCTPWPKLFSTAAACGRPATTIRT